MDNTGRGGLDVARVISVIGRQNSGKTRLVTRMITYLTGQGIAVAAIKHDGHADLRGDDDWEKAGSDTCAYAAAGAVHTVVTGGGNILWRTSRDPYANDPLQICQRVAFQAEFNDYPVDLILVEGFKHSSLPKLVPARREDDVHWLRREGLANIAAVVGCDPALSLAASDWPVYDESDIPTLCQAVVERLSEVVPGRLDV